MPHAVAKGRGRPTTQPPSAGQLSPTHLQFRGRSSRDQQRRPRRDEDHAAACVTFTRTRANNAPARVSRERPAPHPPTAIGRSVHAESRAALGRARGEVWVKLADADQPAPKNPATLVFLTMTTKPTFRAEFKPGKGGNVAVNLDLLDESPESFDESSPLLLQYSIIILE